MDFINTKNIKLQDRLWIQRSGEVIPYVVAVAQSDDTHKQIPSPTNCPACGHLLVQEEIFIRCPDLFGCSEQIIARLTHYVSKHCMDIDGLGPSYIIQLVEQ
jgi:DNA ligase (NAD+)